MKVQWGIFAGSVFLLAGIWLCLAWQGVQLADEMQQREGRLQELKAQAAALQALQSEHNNLELYQLEVAGKRELAEKMLPGEMESAVLLDSIKKAADSSGMELRELVPGQPDMEDGVADMAVKVKLSGDYFSLLDFLRRVQNGTRLIHIDTMDLIQHQDLECQLGMKVFAEKV
ncbi:MAG: type 4a pilus biogenesis protein PilO [Anaerovibrio sp.]|nr:type 4a pilus biogenesis protein PilO [Anaerovibrio sp.]